MIRGRYQIAIISVAIFFVGCGAATNAPRSEGPYLQSLGLSCALPPLNRKEVLEYARVGFGPGFDAPSGFVDPNRMIEIYGCRYKYTQSIIYENRNKPASLDGVDTTRSIYISRDGSTSDW